MASADVKLRAAQTGAQRTEAQISSAAVAHRAPEGVLIRQAQAGRWESFAELAVRYDAAFLALALRLTSLEREARELFQTAFSRVYRELRSYRFQCSFYLWIHRIVTRVCMQFLQQGGRESRTQRNLVDA